MKLGLAALLVLSLLFIACKKESTNTTNKSASTNVSVTQASKLASEGYIFIDLRTPKEIEESGTVPTSIHIDYKDDSYQNKIQQLSKDDKYILYCRSGGRSGRAMKDFAKLGLTAVDMEDGFGAWKKVNP